MQTLKVSSKSSPNAVAVAIQTSIEVEGESVLECMGDAAMANAVKAIAIATKALAKQDTTIACRPSFIEKEVNGENRTLMQFEVGPHLL